MKSNIPAIDLVRPPKSPTEKGRDCTMGNMGNEVANADILAQASRHWGNVTVNPPSGRRRWWQSPEIWIHINRLVNGTHSAAQHFGFHAKIADAANGRILERALSVGCGTAAKELRLLLTGAVAHFDLYEITEERIALGRKEAERFGLTERVTWHLTDAFRDCTRSDYALVYWNNALHHMLDVEQAVGWSLSRLAQGGIFAMDDFIGPSRFQWTDFALDQASRFRAALPDRLLVDPGDPSRRLAIDVKRPTIAAMIETDPTEAADSDSIVKALKSSMENIQITMTGGCIYQLALDDVLANFTQCPEDAALLQIALQLDESLAQSGHSHYAVALGTKNNP